MSEVAKLRRSIELECQALRRMMNEFRMTASHDIINHTFEAITPLQERLADHIGKAEAANTTVEIYCRIIG